MISNFNYASLYGTNNSFYRQMSNNLEQYNEENIDIIKCQQMYSNNNNNQNFLYEAPSVQNLKSFNLDQHLDMNSYSIDFANNSEQNKVNQMTNSNQLNDCLAIDCNLESYSSLSSSSSTSSSTASLSSENKNQSENVLADKTNNNNFIEPEIKIDSKTHYNNNFDSSSLSKLALKNKKLNSLIHGNRKNTHTKSKNKNLKFASVESLSCDEGYVGSYSDTTNSIKIHPSKEVINQLSSSTTPKSAIELNRTSMLQDNLNRLLCPQDQLQLLQFLLEHTFNVIAEDQAPSSSFNECLNSSDEFDVKSNKKEVKEEENSFFIPPIYSSLSNSNSNEPEFENLLNTNDLKCSNPYYQTEFDITDKLQLNNESKLYSIPSSPLSTECLSCYFDDYSWTSMNDLSTSDKLKVIQEEINHLKNEQDRMDQEEMMTSKWRFILEKKRRLELKKNELIREDEIDAEAYLNEIEMNLDYFTHEDIDSATDVEDISFSIDQMLKFKTNNMAFNLRSYHKKVLDQQTSNSNEKKLLIKNKNYNMFANFHVDLIQEFVPVPATITNTNSTTTSTSSSSFPHETIENRFTSTSIDIYSNGEDVDRLATDETNHHHDFINNLNHEDQNETLVEENDTICCNDYQIEHQNYEQQEYYDEENNGNYEYYNEEEYEDYEDQLLIDSLTEEEALALLRSESEIYALQMSQAAKLGISMNEIKSLELGELGGDEEIYMTELVPQSVSCIDDESTTLSKETSDSNNNDIFENVFNCNENTGEKEYEIEFEQHINYHTHHHQQNENHEQHLIDPHHSQYEQDYYENVNVGVYDENGGISSTSPTSYFNSNISLSLRNSLLKLRHSRRHLASLIETTKNSSSSSTTSSLNTNTSSMSLYKQHILNMQQQSSQSSRKPCVYMLTEGRCARADCRFVHDLKTIMCKYWLEGECLKGENCEFLHEIVVEETPQPHVSRRQHKSSLSSTHSHQSKSGSKRTLLLGGEKDKVKAKKIEFKLDTEEFPALGGVTAVIATDEDVSKTTVSSTIETNSNEETNKVTNQVKPISSSKSSNKMPQLPEVPIAPVKTTAASFLFSNITKTKSQVTSATVSHKCSNAVNIVSNKQQKPSTPSSISIQTTAITNTTNTKTTQTGTNQQGNKFSSNSTSSGQHKSRVCQSNKSNNSTTSLNNMFSSLVSSSATPKNSKKVSLSTKNTKTHLNSGGGSRVPSFSSSSSTSSNSSSRQNSTLRSKKK